MAEFIQSGLVEIDFYGDTIIARRTGPGPRDVEVSLRRMCENLGVDFSSQLAKLKRRPWAVVAQCPTTGADGKTYSMTMLSLRSVASWLTDIEADRVAAHVRDKLVRYQLEAADVLADHFMPHTVERAPISEIDLDSNDGLLALSSKLTERLIATTKRAELAEGKVLSLSADLSAAEQIIEESSEAVAFVGLVRQYDDEWTTYSAAQVLQQKPKKFVEWLINEKILFKRDDRLQVYTQYRPRYARIRFSKPFINQKTGKEETSETVVFTREGIEWIAKKLRVNPDFALQAAAE